MVLTGRNRREQVAQRVVEIRLDHIQLGSANRHAVPEIVGHDVIGGRGRRLGSRSVLLADYASAGCRLGSGEALASAGRRTAATRLHRCCGVCCEVGERLIVVSVTAIGGENNYVCGETAARHAM